MKRLLTRRTILTLWAMACNDVQPVKRLTRMCAKRGLLRKVKVPKR